MPVQGELDELEREEFFRLKKVQKNKQKVAARDLAAKEAAQVGTGNPLVLTPTGFVFPLASMWGLTSTAAAVRVE